MAIDNCDRKGNLLSGLDRQLEILRARCPASAPERKDECAECKGQPSGESYARTSDRTTPISAGQRANVTVAFANAGQCRAGRYSSPRPLVKGRDFIVSELLGSYRHTRIDPVEMPAEAPLFLMFTTLPGAEAMADVLTTNLTPKPRAAILNAESRRLFCFPCLAPPVRQSMGRPDLYRGEWMRHCPAHCLTRA